MSTKSRVPVVMRVVWFLGGLASIASAVSILLFTDVIDQLNAKGNAPDGTMLLTIAVFGLVALGCFLMLASAEGDE